MLNFSKIVIVENDSPIQNSLLENFVARLELDLVLVRLEDVLKSEKSEPTIAVSLFASDERKDYSDRTRVRLTHLEYLDLFVQNPSSASSVLEGRLGINAPTADVREAFFVAEQKILQRTKLTSSEIDEDLYESFDLIGRSKSFVKSMKNVKKIAQTDQRVLINGESGTGKEAVARAIHRYSPRRDGPFVPINCGAFSDDMLLSELFGFKKGSFTGAYADQKGLIEHARHGTLFLDEVDSLSLKAQVSLLRFLQDGEIRAIGGRSPKSIDVRVIAASNKSLTKLSRAGAFRDDLLYRLDVLNVKLPALRQRGDDILLIAQHILARVAQELEKEPKYLSLAVTNEILNKRWPGNFRELESALLRAYLLSDTVLIDDQSVLSTDYEVEALPKKLPLGSFSHEKNSIIRQFEKDYIQRVLSQSNGNVTKAAALAKKERRAFTRLMAKHGIDRKVFLSAS